MSEPIRYRRASVEDTFQIEELEKENFPYEAFGRRQIRYLLQSPNSIAITACSNSKILGYIIGLGRRGSLAVRIYSFCVSKDYRLKGIGTSLLRRLEEECQRRGLRYLTLEVGEYNLIASRFYQKKGFVESCRVPAYYSDGTTAIRMRKTIIPHWGGKAVNAIHN
jgi:ribosomal protein S18 acetylase RimI-like enzyme